MERDSLAPPQGYQEEIAARVAKAKVGEEELRRATDAKWRGENGRKQEGELDHLNDVQTAIFRAHNPKV